MPRSEVDLVRLRLQHHLGAVLVVVRASAASTVPASPASGLAGSVVAGAALHVEDVGEVGGDLQLEVHADGQRVRVAQGQLLDQAAREPPAADHQDLGHVAPHGVAGVTGVSGRPSTAVTTRETTTAENGRGRAGGQQLGPSAGDGHPQPAQVAQVVVDQTLGRAGPCLPSRR